MQTHTGTLGLQAREHVRPMVWACASKRPSLDASGPVEARGMTVQARPESTS